MLAEPSASVVSGLDGAERDPGRRAVRLPTPWALSAKATAALETPTFPGVSGRIRRDRARG